MYQKHTVLRFGKMFLSFGILIPAVCIGLSLIPGNEPSRYVMWPLVALFLAGEIVFYRKILLLSVSRVILDENGITSKVPFRKSVTIRWNEVKRCGFTGMETTGGLYDQQWFCFADNEKEFPEAVKSLLYLPFPNEHCIYMVYSEFIWELITKFADKKSYNEAIFKSREIM